MIHDDTCNSAVNHRKKLHKSICQICQATNARMLRAVRGGIHPLDSRDSRTGCRPDPLAMCSDIPSYPMNFMVPAIAQRCCTAGLAPGRAPGCHVWTHMSHVCYRYNNACLHSYRSEYLCTHRHTHTQTYIYIYTHIYI